MPTPNSIQPYLPDQRPTQSKQWLVSDGFGDKSYFLACKRLNLDQHIVSIVLPVNWFFFPTIYAPSYTLSHTCSYTHIRSYIHKLLYTNTHTYSYTHKHTLMHTHIYINAQRRAPLFSFGWQCTTPPLGWDHHQEMACQHHYKAAYAELTLVIVWIFQNESRAPHTSGRPYQYRLLFASYPDIVLMAKLQLINIPHTPGHFYARLFASRSF